MYAPSTPRQNSNRFCLVILNTKHMSDEQIIKKAVTMKWFYESLVKAAGPRGEKDSTDIHDLVSQSILDHVDSFVDYRYEKKKWGMHQINVTILKVPECLKADELIDLLTDHCEEVSEYTVEGTSLMFSLFVDVN